MNLDVWLESLTWYSWPRAKVHQTIASCLPIAPYIVTAGPLLLKMKMKPANAGHDSYVSLCAVQPTIGNATTDHITHRNNFSDSYTSNGLRSLLVNGPRSQCSQDRSRCLWLRCTNTQNCWASF